MKAAVLIDGGDFRGIPQVVFPDRLDNGSQFCHQRVFILGQCSLKPEGIGSAKSRKLDRYRQVFKKCADFLVFFNFTFFFPAAALDFLIQLRVRINSQHVDANQRRMDLIADPGGRFRAGFAPSLAGNANQVEKAVMNAGLIEPPALRHDIGGCISFVHEL